MHPTFKPIFIGSQTEVLNQPHMRIPRFTKMIPSQESWSGSFNEVRDNNYEYVSGDVEVTLMPRYEGVVYQNQICVKQWNWRIVIWGNDDTSMEKYFESGEDAMITFNALDHCPTKKVLYDLWGFGWN